VRCTTGNWGEWQPICGAYSQGTYSNSCCQKISGNRWYQAWCRYGADCICLSVEAGCISEGGCLPAAWSACCHQDGGDPDRGTFYTAERFWECA